MYIASITLRKKPNKQTNKTVENNQTHIRTIKLISQKPKKNKDGGCQNENWDKGLSLPTITRPSITLDMEAGTLGLAEIWWQTVEIW